MSRKRGVSSKPFFVVPDRYASIALGTYRPIGGAFADSDIYVAGRGLSQTVIPDVDEDALAVVGAVEEQAATVRDVLLDASSRRELWAQPGLAMELQSYVTQLLERGEVFIHLVFAKTSSGDYSLFKTSWIAPETIVVRPHEESPYEQFVSWRAYRAPDYHVAGDPKDHFTSFSAGEILHLRWPLDSPARGRAPAAAVLSLEPSIRRAENRSLLQARAHAEPDEKYLSLARGLAGAYGDSLEITKALRARARDMLFYPGASESEWFPWAEPITTFFAADRIIRARIAIAELREYLFDEFSRQVLGAWSGMNDWSEVRLELKPKLFTINEWKVMRDDLHAGRLGLDDVWAAVHAEAETARAFSRR